MIFKKRKACPTSRRGVSSIVGAMIFVVLMVGGFSALNLALNNQTDIVKTHISLANMDLKKQQENFDVSGYVNSSDNTLHVSIYNNGQNPVEISDLFLFNKTNGDLDSIPINANDAIIPPNENGAIKTTEPLAISGTHIKAVSTLGTIKTEELRTDSYSSGILRAKLFTIPPDVIVGQNVTIAMLVTNAATSSVENVTPYPGALPSQVTGASLPTPSSTSLGPGESVLFSWDYTLDGIEGSPVTFSGYASGNYLGGPTVDSNTASDIVTLQVDETGSSSGGGGDPNSLSDELLARPQLFLVIPGPQGDSPNQALWGVNIANPVDAPMEVSKLTISAFAPGANNNDKIFAAPCDSASLTPATNLFPTGTNHWSCPSENLLMWESFASPVTIPPFTTQPFLVKVTPGAIAGLNHLESIIVQASVFTNVGSFGKSGYQTTMYDGNDAIGSVYLSNIVDSVSNSDIKVTRTGISPNSVENFKVVFADLDSNSATYIKPGSKLVINIPKDWTEVTLLNNYGFVNSPAPTVSSFGDGSSQIIATVGTDLGTATNPADTIEFSARAPNITSDRMYVMYVLAEGETETGATDFALGTLSEIILQVDAP